MAPPGPPPPDGGGLSQALVGGRTAAKAEVPAPDEQRLSGPPVFSTARGAGLEAGPGESGGYDDS
ncbi:hypothetical protein LJC59_07830 [Desulfovibrio sp. OttesenSCG-928-A18]|nr:hypothetical protein [Desulfovibrio sp. OttesenSCG-928-A18]